MKSGIAAAAVAALGLSVLAAGAAQAAGPSFIEIRHAVARVVVEPENRPDIKIETVPGRGDLPKLELSTGMDGRMIIDGGLEHRIHGCSSSGMHHGDPADFNPVSPPADMRVRIRGHDDVYLKDAPLIVVHAPMDVRIDAGDATYGAIGRANSVHLGNSGCGDWTVANVAGELHVSTAGSGDVHTGTSGDAKASIAGSGDIHFGAVKNLKASIAGSGDVTAQAADGAVDASIAGSGDVVVKGGRIDRVKASIAGSGDVKVAAAVGDVDASIMGSGDVRVASAGHISKSVMGSGSVIVGQ